MTAHHRHNPNDKECKCLPCRCARDGNCIKVASYMLEELRSEMIAAGDMGKQCREFAEGFSLMPEKERTELLGYMVFSFNKLLVAREREKAIGDAIAQQMGSRLGMHNPVRH